MSLRSKFAAAVHKAEKTMPGDKRDENTKKIEKKGFTSLEQEVETEMGCAPSQAVIIHPPPDQNARLQPTIFMVAQDSFERLRELGELKFYHLAQYDSEETERVHHEFASRLENPVQYERELGHLTSTDRIHGRLRGESDLETNQLLATKDRPRLQEDNSNNISKLTQVTSYSQSSSTNASRIPMCSLGNSLGNCAKLESTQHIADSLENPQKYLEEDCVPPTGDLKTLSVHTLETAKSKTFFRRNRIQPTAEQDGGENDHNLQPQDEVSITEQIEVTGVLPS